MKTITILSTFIIFSFATKTFAQLKVTLEEYETHNRMFSGYIGESNSMPVTFCLNVENFSPDHLNIYSVSGWYRYEKHKKNIPLAGIQTDKLVLYHFENQQKTDTVLHFKPYGDKDGYRLFDVIEKLQDMDGFKEKITFEYGNYANDTGTGRHLYGTWTDGKKELPIKVYEENVTVLQHHSILKITNNGKIFHLDLAKLNVTPYENSVSAYKLVDGKIRILIAYDRPSKAYVLGHCGAGNESGYLWLEVDENGRLLQMEDYLLESCLLSLSSEQLNTDSRFENYLVSDRKGNEKFLTIYLDELKPEWSGEK